MAYFQTLKDGALLVGCLLAFSISAEAAPSLTDEVVIKPAAGKVSSSQSLENSGSIPKVLPAKRKTAANEPLPPSGNASVTTITAKKRLLLDPKGHEATFWGEVKVVDSRFSMACEKLVVYLRQSGAVATEKASAEGLRPLEGSAPAGGKVVREEQEKKSGEGGLEKAVAEGDVVIFQEKVNEKGEVERSVGRAKKAVYDSKTESITLSGWPQVEQKQNTIQAMEEGTVILLTKRGTLEVLGHHKSVLRNTDSENAR